jgi:hypothetical protein
MSAAATKAPAPPRPYVLPYDALDFVGYAGKRGKVVEIWTTDTGLGERSVNAFDRKRRQWVGGVYGRARLKGQLDNLCLADFKAFAKQHDISNREVLQIVGAYLLESYHNTGIGVALYIALAALSHKLNLALAADACFGSSTSLQARRVWNSKEFQKYVHVGPSGLVATWKRGVA